MDRDQLTFILRSTFQAVTLNAISNTIAQLLSCYKQGGPYSVDLTEVSRFMTFALLTCPPNVLWQSYLEDTFPGYTTGNVAGTIDEQTSNQISEKTAPVTQALQDRLAQTSKQIQEKTAPVTQVLEDKAAAINENQTVQDLKRRASDGLDRVRNTAGIARPAKAGGDSTKAGKRLNVRNTAIKFALDQTFGAVINTVLFIAGMGMLKGASWEQVTASVKRDTLTLIFAGQKLWPAVSIISFTLVPLEYRTVFGGFIGIFWGIYLSLFAGSRK